MSRPDYRRGLQPEGYELETWGTMPPDMAKHNESQGYKMVYSKPSDLTEIFEE